MDTAAILTTAAGTDLKPLHHREPVVIEKKNFEAWLETGETSADILTPLLSAPKKGTWRTYPVSKAVNSPRNEGADLIEPIGSD